MAVVMRSGEIRRYDANERLNHWAVAILFILLAASGLAFFHPAFWFLSALLGGGTWARILHPFLGVLMFVLFFAMAMRYWTDNKIQPYDREWSKRLSDVIENRDDNLPAIDKYNIGQKWVFWTMVVTMVLMIISGIIMWRPYFAGAFAIDAIRIAGARSRRVRVHPDPGHHRAHLRRDLGEWHDTCDDARLRVARMGSASSSAVVPAHDGRQRRIAAALAR